MRAVIAALFVMVSVACGGGDDTVTRPDFCLAVHEHSCTTDGLSCPLRPSVDECADPAYTEMGITYETCCSLRNCDNPSELPIAELDACLAAIDEQSCEELERRVVPAACMP